MVIDDDDNHHHKDPDPEKNAILYSGQLKSAPVSFRLMNPRYSAFPFLCAKSRQETNCRMHLSADEPAGGNWQLEEIPPFHLLLYKFFIQYGNASLSGCNLKLPAIIVGGETAISEDETCFWS